MKSTNQLTLTILSEIAQRAQGQASLVTHLTQLIRAAILDGRLAGGLTLPSTRSLTEATGVGRSTWVEVMEQLALEGYLVTRQGASSRVAHIPTGTASIARPERASVTSDRWLLDDPATRVTTKAFRTGLPDLRAFPTQEWARLVGSRCRHPISHDLSYVDPCGLLSLREALLVHLRQTRGLQAEPDQVLVLPSAQAAFAIVAQACVGPGDTAWVEDPGYPGIRSVLRSRGAHIVSRPLDSSGMVLEEPGASPPKLIYTTPSHQFPTGLTMPLPRRLALLQYAAAAQAMVIEDDYDSEYQYYGRPLESLQGLDPHGCVAYVGTFSKTLAPGLRMAYLVVPRHWVALMQTIASVSGYAVPVHFQLAMADFMASGGFQRHLRKVTAEAGSRIQLLAKELKRWQDPRLDVPTPYGGLQLCVGWRGQTNDLTLTQRLHQAGIVALPLSSLCQNSARQGLVLGVGLVAPEDIQPACARLKKVLLRTP